MVADAETNVGSLSSLESRLDVTISDNRWQHGKYTGDCVNCYRATDWGATHNFRVTT
jgi:hypothetical protein